MATDLALITGRPVEDGRHRDWDSGENWDSGSRMHLLKVLQTDAGPLVRTDAGPLVRKIAFRLSFLVGRWAYFG